MYRFFERFSFLHKLETKLNSKKSLPYKIIFFILSRISFVWTKKTSSGRLKIPFERGFGVNNLVYQAEHWLETAIKYFNDTFKGNITLIDVGINSGNTLIKAAGVNPNMKYFGFEPNPHCFVYVQKLVALNPLPNFKIENCGLSSEEKELNLYLRTDEDMQATYLKFFKEFTSDSDFVKTKAITGDSYFEKIRLAGEVVLKIDVEGYELEVVKGLQNTIGKYTPYIICEVLPVQKETAEHTKLRTERRLLLFNSLKAMDYAFFIIMNDFRLKQIHSVNNFSRRIIDSNYLFVHTSKLNYVKELIN